MEFENKEFGACRLLKCNYNKGACLIEIKDKNRTFPYVVTTRVSKDGTWAKAEYYQNLKEAEVVYISMISEGIVENNDSRTN